MLGNQSQAYNGNNKTFFSATTTRIMLTRNKNTDFGYGIVVNGSGDNLYFWKADHNVGYHSLIFMFPKQRKGIAIMTNSETGDTVINYSLALVSVMHLAPSVVESS